MRVGRVRFSKGDGQGGLAAEIWGSAKETVSMCKGDAAACPIATRTKFSSEPGGLPAVCQALHHGQLPRCSFHVSSLISLLKHASGNLLRSESREQQAPGPTDSRPIAMDADCS